MPSKNKLRPTIENRNEVVSSLIEQLHAHANTFRQSYDSSLQSLNSDISGLKVGGVGPRAGFLFLDGLNVAASDILNQNSDGFKSIQHLCAIMNWGQIIDEHNRQRNNFGFDVSTGFEDAQIFIHSLALASGNKIVANWSAQLLANYINAGGLTDGLGHANADFLHFYKLLITAQLDNKWVTNEKNDPALGHFGFLLQHVDTPELFEKALINYCDFRVSRSLLYENMEAKKPRKPTDSSFIFESPVLK